ncbi:PREDICTED: CX3C chemokine receptor 1-like [Calidris pugnax]|uniref:CX3C chemokine receptor 1-like n=1 Tax=Calidris pugnax TaxID=198806 RepID=UPI00071C5162|nr:PREDICTED: CX3C chemokine receptor 1-like [Calidris pugnax]XP_014796901.1 PREDICTED: CX3C chemokine receptor 1-like [Calidris pugnax]XP_014796911.1 PREDICTED: CX3C chemokine receptor 1-like [Calidris pugnax]XP_014796920.1 PREDICTED: CX3C chemokine receptor 1-like [Calidris pugnax]
MTEAFTDTTPEYSYDEHAFTCNKTDIQEFGKIFLPIFYIAVFALGFTGNLMVIFAIVKEGSKKSITDIYLLNLAISDLLFVISLPFWASNTVRGWIFGTIPCTAVSSLYYIGFFGGMFFITVISIDRYLAIVRATYSLKSRTVKHGFLITCGVWAVAILVSVPHFVFSQLVENDCISVFPQKLENIWPVFCNVELNTIGFIIPVCIIGYCYCGIVKTLLFCKNQKKTRAIKLVLVVVVVFFLFWSPYNVMIFLETLKYYELFTSCNQIKSLDYAMHLTETIAFSHCCLNPLIYAFAGQKFRKYLYRVCLKYCPCLCFCGPCSRYQVTSSASYPESIVVSNITQNTSDQDGSVFA